MPSFKMEKHSLKDEIFKGGILLLILSPFTFIFIGLWAIVVAVLALVMILAGKFASD